MEIGSISWLNTRESLHYRIELILPPPLFLFDQLALQVERLRHKTTWSHMKILS